MNAKPQSRFDPSSPRVRLMCAVAAAVFTVATLGFIDALAHGYGNAAPVLAKAAVMVVAHR
jgi:hypothetical protein